MRERRAFRKHSDFGVSVFFQRASQRRRRDRLARGLPESLFMAFNHLQEVRRHDVREIHFAIREQRAHSVGKIYASAVQMLTVPLPAGVNTEDAHCYRLKCTQTLPQLQTLLL